ncbi:hypothetical protein GE061_003311 [Apolygus lucorum]|uniref:Uncharacterized protein n=1 Tax=Apolygus lucorum TaxID=248454 RepID=A0A6A4JC90_APOLU|nr:hypothetical protein GE061_003311 [Apolygus lucorum]
MLLVFLSALLAGTAWSWPQGIDEILIQVAQADIDVQQFFKALSKNDFKLLPEYYSKLAVHRTILKSGADILKNLKIPENAKSIQEVLSIQLDKLLFKLRGILPENEPQAVKEKNTNS